MRNNFQAKLYSKPFNSSRLLSVTALAGSLVTFSVISVPYAKADDGYQVIEVSEDASVNGATGGTLGASLNVDEIYIWSENGATLSLEEEGHVETYWAQIGATADTVGVLSVSGMWSHFHTENLVVGGEGDGEVSIEDRGYVRTGALTVGESLGSAGSISVSGESAMFVDSMAKVGLAGSASLKVEAGGLAVFEHLSLGSSEENGGRVEVLVQGEETSLDANTLEVNGPETTIIVSDRAHLYTSNAHLFSGSISLEGAGTELQAGQMLVGEQQGAAGVVRISEGTALIGKLAIGGEVDTGSGLTGGTGTVSIENGGEVYSVAAVIGEGNGAIGTATITGENSSWELADVSKIEDSVDYLVEDLSELDLDRSLEGGLYVGLSEGATGTVNVVGGSLSTHFGYIGGQTDWNQYDVGGTGTVNITGETGSWKNSQDLIVGSTGSGTLNIVDGGTVETNTLNIGFGEYATGNVLVDGAGSSLSSLEGITLGAYGDAQLDIRNGGAVATSRLTLWAGDSNTSTIHIKGAGSTLNVISNNGYLSYFGVGSAGNASVVLSEGASVSAEYLQLISKRGGSPLVSINSGSQFSTKYTVIGDEVWRENDLKGTGKVEVTGAGSILSANLKMGIGVQGKGALTITDGGSVTAGSVHIGVESNAYGDVVVSGVESTLTVGSNDKGETSSSNSSGTLTIGRSGEGTLIISDGATVSVAEGQGSVILAEEEGSKGTINIGAAKGEEAVAAGNLNAGEVVFGAGEGLLVFNHTNTDYQFNADLVGENVAVEFLSGETALSGDNSDVSATIESGSTLSVNGKLGEIEVLAEGVLGGSGLVESLTVQSGGRVAPGNSIGTLRVTGNTSFGDGTYFDVEIDEAGNSDLLDATGAVTIGSNVTVSVTPEDGNTAGIGYTDGQRYTLIEADGGITGTFDSLISDLYFFDASLAYDTNKVYMDLARNGLIFASSAQTVNQRAVAVNLDEIGLGTLHTTILGLSEEATRDAYDALSGDIYASVNNVLLEDSRFLRSAILENSNSGARQVWAEAYGAWGDWDSDGNAGGVSRNTGGFIAGIDAPFAENFSAGLAAGYGHASIDGDDASSASVDAYHIGAYGGARFGATNLKAGLAYTHNEIDSDRDVRFGTFSDDLSADYDAGVFQIFSEAGYEFETGFVTLTPFAGLAYVNVHSDGFTERGGEAALRVKSESEGSAVTNIGLRINKAFEMSFAKVAVNGSVAWQHVYEDDGFSSHNAFAGGSSFTVSGVPAGQDSAVLDAGISVMFSENVSLGLSYDGLLSNDVQDHSLQASLKAKF
ncbi:autotransporter domain-containing protein [Flexibacterium corallicola]|uniref:autotransporter domain-containing protein n=1 Tax=Flexibacterium corallicola TaxID=3037259 RepID=UPI00286EF6F5|nr:autotransporter domain-containing protein [Pseudovibrio sp. M1P-2-3]